LPLHTSTPPDEYFFIVMKKEKISRFSGRLKETKIS